jgi:NTP pyrophosphatase (non-canonical NTP hydrolase)
MEFNTYQRQAITTAVYPPDLRVIYPVVGLANEGGEALGKIKKVLRRDHNIAAVRDKLIDELGDCLWYVATAARDLDVELDVVAQRNLDKLADRKARNQIRGYGDER